MNRFAQLDDTLLPSCELITLPGDKNIPPSSFRYIFALSPINLINKGDS